MTKDFESAAGSPPDVAHLIRRTVEDDRRDAARLVENKAILMAALARTGVATVCVNFDGADDAGQIEVVGSRISDGTAIDLPRERIALRLHDGPYGQQRMQDQTLSEAIKTVVHHALARTDRGWKNHEGSFGVVMLYVADGAIRRSISVRMTEILLPS